MRDLFFRNRITTGFAALFSLAIVWCLVPVLRQGARLIWPEQRLLRYACTGIVLCAVFALLLVLLCRLFVTRPPLIARAQEAKVARDASLDLLKALAAFLVVFVHTYLIWPFYQEPMTGFRMAYLTFGRFVGLMCVPLFMTLTGMLCTHYTDHKKIGPAILRDLILLVLMITIKICEYTFYLGTPPSPRTAAGWYLNVDQYWYFNMYLGLLLLSPYLNRLLRALSMEQKRGLVLALLFVTSLRSVLPEGTIFVYWARLYPLSYYVIGACLKDLSLNIKKRYVALALFLMLVLLTAMAMCGAQGDVFPWNLIGGYEVEYNALPTVMITVLTILLLRGVRIPALCRKPLRSMSAHTLGIYFASGAVVDTLFYPQIVRLVPDLASFTLWQVPVALADFLLAFIAAVVLTKVAHLLSLALLRILQRSGTSAL